MTGPANQKSQQPTTPAGETATDEVLYSAQLRCEDGRYTLTVTDAVRDTVQVFPVAKKAVDRLPFYLDMLRSKLS
ncbi:hypothetical protein ITI46_18270 [Streptomyces oryzae]|uniref:Flagellar protein FlaG n=1 Tax=Streptomyces oryzae TaxID=1434886 RepID=A0ABS3XE48_9ACTN|nr:hypothetical protein [Streptomyces oryzae]MBO8193591.1 hypothetical protein [Streptomyces oryzae]